MERSLMLNVMHLYVMRNERTARYARDFLKQWRLPIRLLTRGAILELGGNNTHLVAVALRLLREKNIRPVKKIPWYPPEILHQDYKLEANR